MHLFLITALALLSSVDALVPTVRSRACMPPHDKYPFCNTSLHIDARVLDLISRIRPEDKPSLLTARGWPQGNITALPYIGVPAHDWGLNCVHGIQSSCINNTCPTSFANPCNLGASWNYTNVRAMSEIMGTEIRALWLAGAREPSVWSGMARIGLDCWSPNINLNRDPRWGRNQEVASEDPYLQGLYAREYSQGMQQSTRDPRYLQAVATLKHFAAYSLEDSDGYTRYDFDANISDYDLHDSYFAAFREGIVGGGALGVMCSYNSVNGIPSCANPVLKKELRNKWKFEGYVTSDTPALSCIYENCGSGGGHNYVHNGSHAVCLAITQGPTDMCSGPDFVQHLATGVAAGFCTSSNVDESLMHTLRLRFRLGLFDPTEDQPLWNVSMDEVQTAQSKEQNLFSAAQGIVLLKNGAAHQHQKPPLPLDRVTSSIATKHILVVGPSANNTAVLLGNYLGQVCPSGSGWSDCVQTIYEAIREEHKMVSFAEGCESHTTCSDASIQAAVAMATNATTIIIAGGLSEALEAEMHDRKTIALPDAQSRLIAALANTSTSSYPSTDKGTRKKNMILILINGGAVSIERDLPHVDAVLEAFYPGVEGAKAIAKTLFGDFNPGGRLPVTVYRSAFVDEIKMDDMSFTNGVGRTYRYYKGEPLFPFGFGLSYSTFKSKILSCVKKSTNEINNEQQETWEISLTVSNTGPYNGTEVVQVYMIPTNVSDLKDQPHLPRRQLINAQRVQVDVGKAKDVHMRIVAKRDLCLVSSRGERRTLPGKYTLEVTNGVDTIGSQSIDVINRESCEAASPH